MFLLFTLSLGISIPTSSDRGLLYPLECSPTGVLASLITSLILAGLSCCSNISLATLKLQHNGCNQPTIG